MYDLSRDPGERHNLADDPAYAPELQQMRRRLRRYLDGFANPYPLEERQEYLFSEHFAELTKPYHALDELEELIWWRKRWHHRPQDVRTIVKPSVA